MSDTQSENQSEFTKLITFKPKEAAITADDSLAVLKPRDFPSRAHF